MAKCCECGFLAARHTGTQELCEVPDTWRESGLIPGNLYDHFPYCFVKAFVLKGEMETANRDHRPKQFVEVINKERDCLKFTLWLQGYSPKEHRDMLHEKMLMDMQEEMRERDRQWQAEQKNKDRDWQKSVREADQRFQRSQKVQDRIWGLVLLAIGAVVGWVVKWFGN